MNDDQWRAPGREPARGVPPQAPEPAPPPPDPYATPAPFAAGQRQRERVLGGAGYDSPADTNDRVAVTAMVLAIIGVVLPGVGLLAAACGHLALHRLKTSYRGGRGLAIAGLTLGYVMTAVWLSIGLFILTVRSLT